MTRIPIQDEFTNLKISPQRRWQLRQKAKGRCQVCGGPLGDYSTHCKKCVSKYRKKYDDWEPGKRGRPPKKVKARRRRK